MSDSNDDGGDLRTSGSVTTRSPSAATLPEFRGTQPVTARSFVAELEQWHLGPYPNV